MSDYKKDLVDYRFQRALETLEVAKSYCEKSWNSATNRLYYACFYAVLALYANVGIHTHTHNGVISELHKNYVKTGIISKEQGKFYSELFEKRQEGDYEDFQIFTENEIRPLFDKAEDFIETIRKIISKQNIEFQTL